MHKNRFSAVVSLVFGRRCLGQVTLVQTVCIIVDADGAIILSVYELLCTHPSAKLPVQLLFKVCKTFANDQVKQGSL